MDCQLERRSRNTATTLELKVNAILLDSVVIVLVTREPPLFFT